MRVTPRCGADDGNRELQDLTAESSKETKNLDQWRAELGAEAARAEPARSYASELAALHARFVTMFSDSNPQERGREFERLEGAIVNTHLHFDHCGQNRMLPSVPVYVQAAELEAIRLPKFTIPEWAEIATDRRRVIDGDAEIAPGVSVMATPGHTPGHQSVGIRNGDQVEVIVGQCCYTCGEFADGSILPADMHEPSLFDEGLASLDRLRGLNPTSAYFSHDATVFTA